MRQSLHPVCPSLDVVGCRVVIEPLLAIGVTSDAAIVLAGEDKRSEPGHDLRRTAASYMAKLGFAPHVVDRILAHSSGTIRGVAAVYNRFEYEQERRNALAAWSSYGHRAD